MSICVTHCFNCINFYVMSYNVVKTNTRDIKIDNNGNLVLMKLQLSLS
jgi:hypothetical protein